MFLLRLKLFKGLLSLRIKLIRFFVGKLSVVANVTTDGKVVVGNGFAHNVHFVRPGYDWSKYNIQHNSRLHSLYGCIFHSSYCVFDNRSYYLKPDGNDKNDGLTYETAKRTLSAVEQVLDSGDTVFVGPGTLQEPLPAETSGSS